MRKAQTGAVSKWIHAIHAWYERADAAAIDAGREWYPSAAATLREFTTDGGGVWSKQQCAAVCAVLSPRITWRENIAAVRKFHKCAAEYLRVAPVVAGVARNRAKAWEIAQSGDISLVSGPKVSSFYANLCGDFTRVTCDVWAARAAGVHESEMGHIDRARYQRLQASYQRAAEMTGHAPAELQAIVWVAIRGAAH